jgi:hypothetical protein
MGNQKCKLYQSDTPASAALQVKPGYNGRKNKDQKK